MNIKSISRKMLRTFVLIILLLGVSFSANAQKLNLNVKDATIKTILKEITTQTGYNFLYSDALKGLESRVSLVHSSQNESINIVLNKVFAGTDIIYTIKGKQVALLNKEIKAGSRPVNVTGVVKDETGESVPGAAVKNQSTGKTVASDLDGNYVIEAKEGDLLSFSSIGMADYEAVVGKGDVVNVMMKPNAIALDDVVVTGYQTLDKGRATGSFEIVSQKQMGHVISNNINEKLEGAVPGLYVDQNGDMIMRGQATLYAQTRPLMVVDGFPMEYDSYNINPNDVEQISVLKDAAAASIWGVRAANGVVVITTKSGSKNQKTTVSYSGNIKVGSKKNLESLDMMNSRQYIDYEYEGFKNNRNILNPTRFNVYTPAAESYYKFKKGEINEQQMMAEFNVLGEYDHLKDIQEYFYQNPLLQQHSIAISGGSAHSSNYLSLNYENDMGDLKGNNTNRFGFQFNTRVDFAEWIKFSAGVRGNYGNSDIYNDVPYSRVPYYKLKDENGNLLNERRDISQTNKDNFMSKGFLDWNYNRIADRDDVINTKKDYNIAANIQLDIKLPFNFTFTTSGMYTVANSRDDKLYTENSYFTRNLLNTYSYYDKSTGIVARHLPMGGIKNLIVANSRSFTFRNILAYNKKFKNISVSGQAGIEMFGQKDLVDSNVYFGFDPQSMTYATNMDYYSLATEGVQGYDGGKRTFDCYSVGTPMFKEVDDRFFSVFGTANIDLKDKYILFGSIRYDKTNLYGRSAQYRDQPTWSVGGKWIISKENFFQSGTIDLLSLKASYGLSGNIDKSTSPYMIAKSLKDAASGLDVLQVENPENPGLCWEKVYTFNVGLDMALLKNRLNFSLELYNRKTKDALGLNTTDPTSGWNKVKLNTASIMNTGADFSVNATPVVTSNFSYNTTLTISYNYNKVQSVNSNNVSVAMVQSGDPLLGKPVDYIYAYNYAGLNEKGDPMVYNQKGEKVSYSQIGSFSVEDLSFAGRKTPKFFGAWANTLQYRGFELDFMFTYKFGSQIRMPSTNTKTFYATGSVSAMTDKRWRKKGDELTTNVPATSWASSNSNRDDAFNSSDFRTESGNFIRLKSLGLSYNFGEVVNKTIFKDLSLKCSVENLWYWAANSENLDVDGIIMSIAYSKSQYLGKLPRYITVSLNVKF